MTSQLHSLQLLNFLANETNRMARDSGVHQIENFAMLLGLYTWRRSSTRLVTLPQADRSRVEAERELCSILQELNDHVFPIEGLPQSVSPQPPRVCGFYKGCTPGNSPVPE